MAERIVKHALHSIASSTHRNGFLINTPQKKAKTFLFKYKAIVKDLQEKFTRSSRELQNRKGNMLKHEENEPRQLSLQ